MPCPDKHIKESTLEEAPPTPRIIERVRTIERRGFAIKMESWESRPAISTEIYMVFKQLMYPCINPNLRINYRAYLDLPKDDVTLPPVDASQRQNETLKEKKSRRKRLKKTHWKTQRHWMLQQKRASRRNAKQRPSRNDRGGFKFVQR
jgi:hypothetical protein